MIAPYLAAFGLKEAPFSKEVPDADLWLPTSKQTVVDGLLDALSAEPLRPLVAQAIRIVGAGKPAALED